MKASEYNIIVSLGEGRNLVFNTLTHSLVLIDDEVKDVLEQSEEISLPPGAQEELVKGGILIEDEINEKKILKYNFERAKYDSETVTFTIVTTYACNLACPYCYVGKGEILTESMNKHTTDIVTRFVQNETQRNRSKTVNIVLYGGEPLLNSKSCFRILNKLTPWARTHSIDLTTHIDTNGTLLTRNMIEKLSEHTIHVRIAFHGPKEVHDRIRVFKNGKGTYDMLMHALRLLTNADIPVSLCINVDKESINKMDTLLDDLETSGFSSIPIRFSFVSPVTTICRHYSKSCVEEEERVTIMYELWSRAEEKGFTTITPGYRGIFCAASARNHFIIDPLLDVYKCADLIGQREHRAGVLNECGEFEPEFNWYNILARDPLAIEGCTTCTLLPLCKGGCMNTGFIEQGVYHAAGCHDRESMILSLKKNIEKKFRESLRNGHKPSDFPHDGGMRL